ASSRWDHIALRPRIPTERRAFLRGCSGPCKLRPGLPQLDNNGRRHSSGGDCAQWVRTVRLRGHFDSGFRGATTTEKPLLYFKLIERALLPRGPGVGGTHVVRAEPRVGFLLLGRPLMIAQMRSAVDHNYAASFVSRGLRQQS